MDADILVIGGGLAGISAALELSDKGRTVLLVERRARLSGVAGSFRRGELTVDTGQHVFLRCCTEYRRFLDRLGVTDRVALQSHLHIPVLGPDGRQATLARTPGLPAPLHLSATLARYALLSRANRARAIAGALALKRLDPEDPELDQQTLGGYLRRHHQNDATLEALWGVVAVATLNLDPDQASLALAAKVFRTGLLDKADAGDVGYAIRPLGELHDEAAARALSAA
ncbi:MAG: squalene-associated FAD-dependent desaturase, partial [Frankiales bacterium]|nr:squalene-associated FAD-dependent desaturase [Frankiales bacterium]